MKTSKSISIIALMAMFLAIGLSSCIPNANNKNIVGLWRYTYSQSDESIVMKITGVTTYNPDNTSQESGTITYIIKINDEESYLDGVEMALTYSFKGNGTYSVSGTTLSETVNDVNISFKSAKTNLPAEYQDIERELIKLYRNKLEENNFKVFKDNMYGTTTSEIVTVNDSKMVLKSIDADGGSDVTEYTRLYQAR